MRRTTVGIVAAVVLVAALVGVGLSPAAGQTVENETTVDCSYPITVSDASGENVTVEDEPDDVVVLGPSAAQVMWEIGAQDKVEGMPVQYHTEYLNGTSEKENVVGEEGQPRIETIVRLEPDLVLAPNVISDDAVEQLRDADLTVYRFDEATSIEDVVAKTQLTGRLVGEYDTAREVSSRTQATVETYENATAEEEQPTVYYAMGGGYTAGPDTFIGDVIEAAGGENIARSANISGYEKINPEVVREQDPDWIVAPEGIELPSGPAINQTTAIQEDQIVRVDRNYISQPGPRVTEPLERMATAFEHSSNAAASTTTSGPGFGPAVAMVGLAGAGVLARRR